MRGWQGRTPRLEPALCGPLTWEPRPWKAGGVMGTRSGGQVWERRVTKEGW